VTLAEFEQQVFAVAMASPICGIPAVRRLTPTSINLRVDVTMGGLIDAFYNEQTGTTAFALVRQGQRVFGADNTGGWHVHPFASPERHDPLPGAMTFAQFVAEIERYRM
jgi:Ethanolamine utilization protein EutJ (predicted chaperonin)